MKELLQQPTCNKCADASHCAGIGYCLAAVEEGRRQNRIRMNRLSVGERFALMFGHKLPPKDEDFAAKPKQQPQP
jgi:hypothetical protein